MDYFIRRAISEELQSLGGSGQMEAKRKKQLFVTKYSNSDTGNCNGMLKNQAPALYLGLAGGPNLCWGVQRKRTEEVGGLIPESPELRSVGIMGGRTV